MISETLGAVLRMAFSAVSVVWRKYMAARLVGTSKTLSLLLKAAQYSSLQSLTLLQTLPPVGCVQFLEQPTMAFVRLNEAVFLESVLEVPIPVRFIFVLLGPSQANMDYHEIGRSISTLMSDKVRS